MVMMTRKANSGTTEMWEIESAMAHYTYYYMVGGKKHQLAVAVAIAIAFAIAAAVAVAIAVAIAVALA